MPVIVTAVFITQCACILMAVLVIRINNLGLRINVHSLFALSLYAFLFLTSGLIALRYFISKVKKRKPRLIIIGRRRYDKA